jgi:hypothetical protein
MKLLGLVILLAACSSSSSRASDASIPSDGSGALTCGTTIADYCAANPCDQTLAAAQQDKSLCPASQNVCDSYTVVTRPSVDTSMSLYYLADQLVAIDHTLLPGHRTCTAGPSTFSPPTCGPGGQQLPACSP